MLDPAMTDPGSDPRQRAEALEAAGAPADARVDAWLAVAEAEPCFRWRAAPGRAALERAITHMPVADRPDLDTRAALRRAELELAEDHLEAARALADLAAVTAGRADQRTHALLGRVVSARAALRDPELAAGAAGDLAAVAAEVAAAPEPTDRLLGVALGAQLAVAFGEQRLVALDLDGARHAYDQAESILREAPAGALPDARFLALQGTALTAQVMRSYGRAADRLRTIVRLVNAHGSPRDELEARMALGHTLTQLGKHADAVRHMDLARALATRAAGVDVRILAAQSAALAAVHGKSWGRALDRAYEALQLAGLEQRSLTSYVAAVSLIAQIHLAREQPSAAYLALVHAAAALRQRLGPQATVLVEVQIEELKRTMGAAKFEAMCEDILRTRADRDKLQPPE
jgi:hypothetical protein